MNQTLNQSLSSIAVDQVSEYGELALAIECATMPLRSEVFLAFFTLGEELAREMHADSQWQFYRAQFELLLRAVQDEMLPQPWRRSCYETLNKPLLSLLRIAHNEQRRRQLSNYYLHLNKQVATVFKLHPF